MNRLYLITGPAGVGKSTVCNILAKKLNKSVLIEGDDLYHMVKGGYVSPWKENNHLDLFWKNVINIIRNSLEAGYDVVFNYVIKNTDYLRLKNQFKDYEVIFRVLLANEDELLKRDKTRVFDCQMKERCLILLEEFKNEPFEDRFIIDSTDLSAEDTADRIMR